SIYFRVQEFWDGQCLEEKNVKRKREKNCDFPFKENREKVRACQILVAKIIRFSQQDVFGCDFELSSNRFSFFKTSHI
ncbi:hypothetical protein DERP_015414, partial [Dermatophagoides pteronyssinus]